VNHHSCISILRKWGWLCVAFKKTNHLNFFCPRLSHICSIGASLGGGTGRQGLSPLSSSPNPVKHLLTLWQTRPQKTAALCCVACLSSHHHKCHAIGVPRNQELTTSARPFSAISVHRGVCVASLSTLAMTDRSMGISWEDEGSNLDGGTMSHSQRIKN
jgi:hypothetical protein